MPMKKTFVLEEITGQRYPSLQAAQALALPGLAEDLAATIQGLLLAGVLTRHEGRIIPAQRKEP